MNKYRIVEFESGKFALQKLLLGFIPINSFKDLTSIRHHWGTEDNYFSDCLASSLEELKTKCKQFTIKRVVNDN